MQRRSETSSWFYLSVKQGSHQKRLGHGEHQFLRPPSRCGVNSRGECFRRHSGSAAILQGYSFLRSSDKNAIVAGFTSSTTHFYDGGPGHTGTRGRHTAAQRTSRLAAGLVFPQWLYLSLSLSLPRTRLEEKDPSTQGEDRGTNSFSFFGLTFLALISRQPAGKTPTTLQLRGSPRKRAMRRSRNAPPKGDEGGDDSGQMVVGTGVTMDFSAMDDPSLTVVVRGVMRHAVLKTENVIVTGRLHGNVEAKTLEISKGALFLGKAMVGSATVAGRLEGILVVGDMLTMRSSGHCDGVLRYGQLNVQHGGKLTGAVKAASPADVGIGDIPVPDLPPGTWDDFWG
ncbi:unnamed protein product, partial [Ectocarpus sp. 4 AP-2014]